MAPTASLPVLIIGAGPSGLTLACELARRGVRCRIVDKAPELFIGSRGKGLQPRTMEVFDDLGVINEVLQSGRPFPDFRCYAGERVAWTRSLAEMLGIEKPVRAPNTPYPSTWLIPQWRTDEILRDRLIQLGGQVELATELTALEQDSEGVFATVVRAGVTERIHARYLIGADGGRSFVRKEIGVSFAGETFDTERTLIGDVLVDGPLDHDHCHMLTRSADISSSNRFSLWGLPGTDYFQFVANVGIDEIPDMSLGSLQRMMEERSGRSDIHLHDLRWISLHRINVRMVDRFRVGRVFLSGDAAHVHSSAGGQGLNASVQDAYNLGWKLAAVLSGAPAELLDTYEAERLPIAADLLGITTRWHHQDFKFSEPVVDDRGPSRHKIFQLTLNYRGGPLALEAQTVPGNARAGDRAPDAPCHDAAGTTIRLFDLFRGPHFTLMAFGPGSEAAAAEINAYYGTTVRAYAVVLPGTLLDGPGVVDADGHIHQGYGIERHPGAGQLVLVRPDGYIGLTAGTDAIDAVRKYLARMTA
jgi:2-polyprenyl-6-methoxyphenol hydroxylase-like FAD-dependent oxidoreductase